MMIKIEVVCKVYSSIVQSGFFKISMKMLIHQETFFLHFSLLIIIVSLSTYLLCLLLNLITVL